MDLELRGRTAVVTGASKGIGLACARGFAAEGCHVHLVSRSADALDAAARAIGTDFPGAAATVHAFDLSRPGAAEALAERCPEADVLVNNAGAIPPGDVEGVDEATWREAWDLKVFGYVNLTRAYFGRMKARGSGAIVNVVGTAGEFPDSGYIAGTAGNAALMAFTRGVGSRSLDHGVRVVAVNPGPIETDRIAMLMQARAEKAFGDSGRWREYFRNSPQGRPGRPEEVADLVVYLASVRASWVNGTVVTINGGRSA